MAKVTIQQSRFHSTRFIQMQLCYLLWSTVVYNQDYYLALVSIGLQRQLRNRYYLYPLLFLPELMILIYRSGTLWVGLNKYVVSMLCAGHC